MKLTKNVIKIIGIAGQYTVDNEVRPYHLLFACAKNEGCVAGQILKSLGVSANAIAEIRSVSETGEGYSDVLLTAQKYTEAFGLSAIVSEVLLFVLAEKIAQTKFILNEIRSGLADAVSRKSLAALGLENFKEEVKTPYSANNAEFEGGASVNPRENDEKKLPESVLNLGIDLTEKARQGKIDNIIGRDDETQRMIEILCRKTKNNPVLIGEAGVGKSAIVEGLALRIISGDVPEILRNKIIFSLDIGSLMAGTKYRGELENRLQGLLKLCEERKDIILFIDELHTIATATGDKENGMGIGEILKPKLARGDLQTVGATTLEEYRKYIEKDPALERRFAPIIVNPPSTEQAIEILAGLKEGFESFHKVEIGYDAIVAAVSLSDRYINDRNLPDKAIDVLDEACSKAKIRAGGERAAITSDDIAEVVSCITKIPVSKISKDESESLNNLADELKKSIIGQDKACDAIASAIRRARAGVGDTNRPIGSFFFLGRTGVGKTEVCKVLARTVFSSEKSLIKLDMSEFQESHSVSKLIGSPAGYVGYDDASVLCEKVRKNPYCIVLFDEIEKAHADVYNLLLQILDEGHLTDSHGKKTSFRNAIIVMTSNVGVSEIKKTTAIGFGEDRSLMVEEESILAGMKKHFKPEFLNRIDNIIVFNSLSKENVKKIAALQLEKFVKMLSGKGVEFKYNDDLVDFIVEKGYDPEFGARPIKRVIQKEVEDKVAEIIISNQGVREITAEMSEGRVKYDYLA